MDPPPLRTARHRFLSAQSDYELAQSMGDESQDTMRQYAACLVQLGMQLDQAGDLAGADRLVIVAHAR